MPTKPVCRWKRTPRSAFPRNHRFHLLCSSTLPFSRQSAAAASSSDATTTSSASFSASNLSSSIATPPFTFTRWSLDQRHMLALNAVACVVCFLFSVLIFVLGDSSCPFALDLVALENLVLNPPCFSVPYSVDKI